VGGRALRRAACIPGSAAIPSFEQNRLLALLADGELRQLVPDMQDLTLEPPAVLFEPGHPINHVYFPLTGIVSLIVTGDDGGDVEVATIGNEGMVGLGGLLAGDVSFSRQVVQLRGQAVRIARRPFLAAVNRSRDIRAVLAAHADAFASQLMQSAACNARHDAEQRLARWILTMADRSGKTMLSFTHHAVAEMLGVQRPTVTLAARMMQSAGLIDYRRGTVTLVDRAGLMDVACECYRIIRRAYDNALNAEGGKA
jgi:CRP-like cAMP-binding protein